MQTRQPEREEQEDRDLLILGEAVRRVCEQRGVGVSELASASGIAPVRIRALHEGRLDPDYELLLTLADSAGVCPSVFILAAEDLQAHGL